MTLRRAFPGRVERDVERGAHAPDLRRGHELVDRLVTRKALAGAALCVCLVFTGVAAVSYPRYLREDRSRHWPTTQGTLTRVELRERELKFTRGYRPEVDVAYGVAGTEYVGHRITFHSLDTLLARDTAEAVVRPYAVGRTVTVYYDPERPAESVLVPGLRPEQRVLARLCVIFFCLGGAGALAAALQFMQAAQVIAPKVRQTSK